MEISYSQDKIEFERDLSSLDKFVLDFTELLNKLKINYVIVSGYVSILFGRNRTSEDIDLVIEKIPIDKFKILWENLSSAFECININNVDEAYNEYLLNDNAIRFSRINQFIPNIEFKFPKIPLESLALKERKLVILNHKQIHISPIELQISFKVFLGSEKDIEDARYLYDIFKDKLDLDLLTSFNRKLKIEEGFNKYIR